MKKISITIILSLLFIGTNIAQNKWVSYLKVDVISTNKKFYFYNDENNRIIDTYLDSNDFPINSFGIQGDYNYFIFNKLSLGVLGAYQFQSKPDFSMLKLGGILRYYLKDKNKMYIYLQDANNFTLNSNKFKSGNNLRLGIGLPVLILDNITLNFDVFLEQNFFRLDNSVPLLGINNERPRTLTNKSYGVSLGVKL